MRERKPLVVRTSANQEWALDFVHDAVECGRTIRVLSVVDAYPRECLALDVDTSFACFRCNAVRTAREQHGNGTEVSRLLRNPHGPQLTVTQLRSEEVRETDLF